TPIASITLSSQALTLARGDTSRLVATARNHDGATVATAAVSWSSSDPAVATVSSAGLVTAMAPGTASVTATSDGISSVARVVVADGSSVATVLEPTWASIAAGETVLLAPPAGTAPGTTDLGWQSSNPA